MKTAIVYKYTSPSGKVYIGQTINELARRAKHKRESTYRNTKFYTAIRKYGFDNFQYEILYSEVLNDNNKEYILNLLNDKEEYYITLYNSVEKGYNILPKNKVSPMNYISWTDEQRKTISDRMKGNNYAKGRISERKGVKGSTKGRPLIPINQFSIDDKFIKSWESAKQIELELNILAVSITKCCKGVYKTAGNYKWKYKT
jgi:group I intron endonuclease